MARTVLASLVLSLSVGCTTLDLRDSSTPAFTYEKLVTVFDEKPSPDENATTPNKRRQRETELRAAWVGCPATKVKAEFEHLGYDCEVYRPAGAPLLEVWSGSLGTGILWLEYYRPIKNIVFQDVDENGIKCLVQFDVTEDDPVINDGKKDPYFLLLCPKERIFFQFDKGVITRVAAPGVTWDKSSR
jgi:hypothetical protein